VSDLISRDDAIRAVHEEFDEVCVWDESGLTTANEVESILDGLPSAEPKTGKWEIKTETDEYGLKRPKLVCSKCKKEPAAWDLTELFEFCPNCGARMNGGGGK